ncbi:MAG TPA: DUF2934 domain-containing protein [Burkholderiales bacterium]|nr:DUF2934 domain-containing protein [Burkholderiales bacterium]
MTTPQRHKPAPRHGGPGARRRGPRRPARTGAAIEDPGHGFSQEEWHDMVSTAAYYRAQARGFENGSADEDWFEAEAELRERLGAAESDVEAAMPAGGGPTDIETKGD